MEREPFYTWTIYDHPADWPFGAVVRRFNWAQPTLVALYGTSVEHVRRMLLDREPWLACIPRQPEDDPNIVETWL